MIEEHDIHSVAELLHLEKLIEEKTELVNELLTQEGEARAKLILVCSDLEKAKNNLKQIVGLRDSKKKVLTLLPKG